MHHRRRPLGRVRVVRDDDDRLLELPIQPLQQREHFLSSSRRAGPSARRGESPSVGDDRARDGHALLLAAGELPRIVIHAVVETDDT